LKYFLWLISCDFCPVVVSVDSAPVSSPFNYFAYPVLQLGSRSVDVLHKFSFKRLPD